jgi:hypothetical protein
MTVVIVIEVGRPYRLAWSLKLKQSKEWISRASLQSYSIRNHVTFLTWHFESLPAMYEIDVHLAKSTLWNTSIATALW